MTGPLTATLDRPVRSGAPARPAVSVWIEDAGRARLTPDALRRLVHDRQVTGLACGPHVTTEELRRACAALAAAGGGPVSAGLTVRGSGDAAALLGEARVLHGLVARPDLLVCVPAAPRALPAVADMLAEGIGVHVAWIGSAARYGRVLDAFRAGLERARAAGLDLSRLHTAASVPVRRIDAVVDARLDAVGGHETAALRGRAGLATARLVRRAHRDFLASPRWRALAAAGAREPRPVWSLGGPPVRSGESDILSGLAELAAPGATVALPEDVLGALDGQPTVTPAGPAGGGADDLRHEDARRTISFLDWYGISAEDSAACIERRGLARMLPGM
ncbi:transaldolase family protein [Streptomyces roseifaciens]|uniref:transaldolase family protein n=1 Tax=Streptomyces roseifaciens TaxID=1488406 RepID=UPI000717F949|nr:transaldolase family protein [Streptomyces roseifaciens]